MHCVYILIDVLYTFSCAKDLAKQVTNTSGGKIIAKKCDVTNEAEVLSIFAWIKQTFNRLDVFVNNAGIIRSDLLLGSCVQSVSRRYKFVFVAFSFWNLLILNLIRNLIQFFPCFFALVWNFIY